MTKTITVTEVENLIEYYADCGEFYTVRALRRLLKEEAPQEKKESEYVRCYLNGFEMLAPKKASLAYFDLAHQGKFIFVTYPNGYRFFANQDRKYESELEIREGTKVEVLDAFKTGDHFVTQGINLFRALKIEVSSGTMDVEYLGPIHTGELQYDPKAKSINEDPKYKNFPIEDFYPANLGDYISPEKIMNQKFEVGDLVSYKSHYGTILEIKLNKAEVRWGHNDEQGQIDLCCAYKVEGSTKKYYE